MWFFPFHKCCLIHELVINWFEFVFWTLSPNKLVIYCTNSFPYYILYNVQYTVYMYKTLFSQDIFPETHHAPLQFQFQTTFDNRDVLFTRTYGIYFQCKPVEIYYLSYSFQNSVLFIYGKLTSLVPRYKD